MGKDDITNSEETRQPSENLSIVSAPSLRIPNFWPNKAKLWFNGLEAQFNLNRITKDETKYSFVISQLDEKNMEEVEDIITNPPDTNKYENLKAELIKRLSDSDGTRVRKLLESEEIGDRTPSQFWRHLKNLSGSSVSDEFLTQMWKNRLPKKVQLVLAGILDIEPKRLTEVADQAYGIAYEKGDISVVSSKASSGGIDEQIKQLNLRMDAMACDIRKLTKAVQKRGRSRSRDNSTSRSHGDDDQQLCWYHRTFAEKSTRCKSPCNWRRAENTQDRP